MSWEKLFYQGIEPVCPKGWMFAAQAGKLIARNYEEYDFIRDFRRHQHDIDVGNKKLNEVPVPRRRHFDAPPGDVSLLDLPLDQVTGEQATRRLLVVSVFEAAFTDIGRAAYDGKIKASCRPKTGGALTEVPIDWWSIDDPWPRLSKCAINPLYPFADEEDFTHWLFFEEDGFLRFCDEHRIFWKMKPVHSRFYVDNPEIMSASAWNETYIPATADAGRAAPVPERKKGPPEKYNWAEFYLQCAVIANTPDGLPDQQKDLKTLMLAWIDDNWPHEPADSLLREKISALYLRMGK